MGEAVVWCPLCHKDASTDEQGNLLCGHGKAHDVLGDRADGAPDPERVAALDELIRQAARDQVALRRPLASSSRDTDVGPLEPDFDVGNSSGG